MNEIPFEVIFWNKWFQLGGILMFWSGYLFAHLLPLLKPEKKEENKKSVAIGNTLKPEKKEENKKSVAIGNTGVSATYDYDKKELTLTHSNGKVQRYSGRSTQWFELPMMESCPTMVQLKLYDIYHYIEKWGNPYPTAHTKTNSSKV